MQMEPSQPAGLKKPTPKRSFLRQGQGIARFGVKEPRAKFKNKPKRKGIPSHLKSPQDAGIGKSVSSPVLHGGSGAVESRQWKAISPAGILAGEDSTEVIRCSYNYLQEYLS